MEYVLALRLIGKSADNRERRTLSTTFVAIENDVRAVQALEVLKRTPWLPNCSTRVMFFDENGFVEPGPQEAVFFTCEGDLRFSSRWLCVSNARWCR